MPFVEAVSTVASLLNGRVVVGEEDRRTLLLLQELFGRDRNKWGQLRAETKKEERARSLSSARSDMIKRLEFAG